MTIASVITPVPAGPKVDSEDMGVRVVTARTGESPLAAFTISAHDTLLGHAVAALVRELRPQACVALDAAGDVDPAGLRVSLDGQGRWVFISSHCGPDGAAVEAVAAGACAVLNLDSRPEEVQLALDALADASGGYVPLSVVQWMAGRPAGAVASRAQLSAREREVLQLVARGYSNSEIARALTISANTVRTHLHALSMKLEASGRLRMLANARAAAIPEAFESTPLAGSRAERVSA